MRVIWGHVRDAGGGEIAIVVGRYTVEYPEAGDAVVLVVEPKLVADTVRPLCSEHARYWKTGTTPCPGRFGR